MGVARSTVHRGEAGGVAAPRGRHLKLPAQEGGVAPAKRGDRRGQEEERDEVAGGRR